MGARVSEVREPGSAAAGRRKIEWAMGRMRVLGALVRELEPERPLEGMRVGMSLHLEAKTAALAISLERLGARVSITSSNPLSTQDDVAAALAESVDRVYAWRGETEEEYLRNHRRVLDDGPQLIVDDGADLSVMAHETGAAPGIIGATEETTTGVLRFRAMEREGVLRFPVIAVNDAMSKHLYDNRFGSGQSVLDGVMRATNMQVGGKRVVVIGYGWVGKGVAERFRGMGARVSVVEVDPFKALEAYMDGYEVLGSMAAARVGDIFITCTGNVRVLTAEHFRVMKDGAVLANAGHFDVEVDVRALRSMAASEEEVRPNVREFRMGDGRRLYLLGEGRLVNLVAADGHPIEVMDMSFATQLLAVVYLARNRGRLESRVHPLPRELDEKVVRTKLAIEGIEIDSLTEEQRRYLESWRYRAPPNAANLARNASSASAASSSPLMSGRPPSTTRFPARYTLRTSARPAAMTTFVVRSHAGLSSIELRSRTTKSALRPGESVPTSSSPAARADPTVAASSAARADTIDGSPVLALWR
jgi:adenosylhomocysteinase